MMWGLLSSLVALGFLVPIETQLFEKTIAVEVDDLYRNITCRNMVVSRQRDRDSLPATVCAPTDCYYNHSKLGMIYGGSKSVTMNKLKCSNDGTSLPREYDGQVHHVTPEADTCSSPLGKEPPWCFTSGNQITWDYCEVPECKATECFVKPPWQFGAEVISLNGTSAKYTCKERFRSSNHKTEFEATCDSLWIWESDTYCEALDCYTKGTDGLSYAGRLAMTDRNRTCVKRTPTRPKLPLSLEPPNPTKLLKKLNPFKSLTKGIGIGRKRKRRSITAPARCHVIGDMVGCYTKRSSAKPKPCDVSECRECGPPPIVPAADVYYTNSSITVYICKDSFQYIRGATTIKCLGNGEWTKPSILCARSYCYYLYPGRKHIYVGTVNMTASGQPCLPWSIVIPDNYLGRDELFPEDGSVADASNYCRSLDVATPPSCSGAHDKELVVCDVIQCKSDCGLPPDLPFSKLKSSYHNEFTAEYTCKPGYSLGEFGRHLFLDCLHNTWLPRDKRSVCKPVQCQSPHRVLGATPILPRQHQRDYQYPYVLHYTCKRHYLEQGGSAVSQCLPNGSWSYPTLNCIPTTCFYKREDGNIEYGGNTNTTAGGRICLPWSAEMLGKFNAKSSPLGKSICAGFGCKEKHRLCCQTSASAIEDCDVPECQEIDCGQPPSMKGTFLQSLTSQYFPGRAYYQCKSQHVRVSGISMIQCQKNGEWEELPLTCAPKQCYIRHSRHGVLYSGKVSFTRDRRPCQMWSLHQPEGEHDNYCRALNLPGDFVGRNKKPEQPWCYVNDSRKLWEYCDIPECLEMNCGRPPSVKGTFLHRLTSQFFPGRAYYKCKYQHVRMSGINMTQCQQNGEWEDLTLTCAPKQCYIQHSRHGMLYSGKVSFTRDRRPCQMWSLHQPEGEHDNYCRALNLPGDFVGRNKKPEQPWCYVNDSRKLWEYCDIPECLDHTGRKPSFENGDGSDTLSVMVGMNAVLQCHVKDIDENLVVWSSKSTIFIGERKSSEERRHMLMHQWKTQWDLCIQNIRAEDQGQYQCSIDTTPRLSKEIRLVVKQSECSVDEFPCQNGECLPNHKKCDGQQDCNDASDEYCDRCENVKCFNGGTNIASSDVARCCQCPIDLTGRNCENCDSEVINCNNGWLNPRPVNGHCICSCYDDYTGKFCQFKGQGGNYIDLPRRDDCSKSFLDVIFILDIHSISEEDLFEFVKHFIDLKSAVPGAMNIGLFTSNGGRHRRLSPVTNSEQLIFSTEKNPHNIQEFVPLDNFLMYARKDEFGQLGDRITVPNVIIVLTVNYKWNLTNAVDMALKLRNDNVHLMILCSENTPGAQDIASHQDAVIKMKPFTDFSPFKMAQKTVLALCTVCDKGWHHIGNSCYRLFVKGDIREDIGADGKAGIKWTTADTECRKYGSALISINTLEEERSVEQTLIQYFHGRIHIGLIRDKGKTNVIYRTMFRWIDGKPPVYDNWVSNDRCWNRSQPDGASLEACAAWDLKPNEKCSGWLDVGCSNPIGDGFICESSARSRNYSSKSEMPHMIPPRPYPLKQVDKGSVFMCQSGEIVSLSSRCDMRRDCTGGDDEHNCTVTKCGSADAFKCSDGSCIPVGLYCNFIPDCPDKTDEDCVHPKCSEYEWPCLNRQCIRKTERCDFQIDCIDGSDEEDCAEDSSRLMGCFDGSFIPISWKCDGIVDCPGQAFEDESSCEISTGHELPCGRDYSHHFSVEDACDNTKDCPNGYDETDAGCYSALQSKCTWNNDLRNLDRVFLQNRDLKGLGDTGCSNVSCKQENAFFKCPGAYCIPSFLLCNGVYDCPEGEDEAHCGTIACPGSFRCANDTSCIQMRSVFDDEVDCPLHDDESYYHAVCSASNCSCRDASVTCSASDSLGSTVFHVHTRKINITRIYLNKQDMFENLHYLAELIISNCSIEVVPSLEGLWNLLSLDLSYNKFTSLAEKIFDDLDKLRYLYLHGNRKLQYLQPGCCHDLVNLEVLKIDGTGVAEINQSTFQGLSKLKILSAKEAKLSFISADAFTATSSLEQVILTGNPNVQFEKGVYDGMSNLRKIETDNFYLCCEEVRPSSVEEDQCKAPNYGISSCTDLLQKDPMKIFVWLLSSAALVGNLMSLGYRLMYDKESLTRGYGVFVSSLGISDFIMGVYMMIIATADSTFRGEYMWKEYGWRHSWTCKVAGFLSTLSCEASTLFICLITLDRFLVIKFPLSQMKFKRTSAMVVSLVVWMVCLVLASIPLLPWFSHWKLYSRNGVCLALPLTEIKYSGQKFSFALFIGLNFLAFMFIAVGQAAIYKSMRSGTFKGGKVRNSQDIAVAKKLSLIVVTDFLCWFPICVMGFMSATGTVVPRETYAWTAVFVLPINSALNPFLYTFVSAVQRRIKELKDSGRATSRGKDAKEMPKVSVGFPEPDLVSLRTYFDSKMMSTNDVVVCLVQVMGTLSILQVRQKSHEPLTLYNIYIKAKGKNLEKICFSVDKDRDRGIEEDVMAVADMMNELLTKESCTSSA